ncbi:MAG: S-layer homology domain-containing protein [Eubacteriales bacterium]|nr:S-layer homology domain-containing protein [Eubacteriales bacterium]
MKKIISIMLVIAVLLSLAVTVSAENETMKKALAGVKERIDIPDGYTTFRSSMTEYGKESYYFHWSEEGSGSLSVHTDSEGRIMSYDLSKETPNAQYPSLPELSREQARILADKFLQRSAPELVENDTDKLYLESTSAEQSGSITYYGFTYYRKHNASEVLNNNAHITVTAYDGVAYVSDVGIEWNYDTSFSDDAATLENPEAAYYNAYPIELRYERTYENIIKTIADGTEIVDDVVLLYGFKDGAGYISAVDGKVLELEIDDEYRLIGGSGGANTAMKEQAADMAFTEQEMAELERVDGLMTKEEAEKLLRSIPSLSLTNKMTVKSVRVYRQRPWYLTDKSNVDDEKFMISISLRDEERGENVNMTADAESGEVKNIYRYGGEEKKGNNAKAEIDAFVKAVAPEKLSECEAEVTNEDEYGISANLRRIVNGVPYSNNGIRYSYSKEYSRISSYDLEWDEYTDFTEPKQAMEIKEAEKRILEHSPLKTIYIPNGGKYRLCYTISKTERQADIDAVTGKVIYESYPQERMNINYSDIGGHWSEQAVRALADAGIGEAVSTFKPNEKMTQKELLVYLASAFLGRYYWEYDEDSFYEMLDRCGYMSMEEKNPSEIVLREDAFRYMIKFMGFERVAQLEGIYTCEYTDSAELSKDKIGYAAILSGFGVVSGNGQNLRPKNEITRAECAMMIYKYFTYRKG